jgi:oligopeptide transport system substrate-binding protein
MRIPPARLTLLAAALALLLSACGRPLAVDEATRRGILLLGNGPEPQALDPHITTGVADLNIHMALFEGLVSPDPRTLAPLPGMAASWTVSADGTTYTFALRPEARWANGDPLTAADFVFSLERVLHPRLAAANASLLHVIAGAEAYNRGAAPFADVAVRAVDPSILEIRLTEPTPYFLQLLMHPVAFPVHPPTVRRHGDPFDRANSWSRPANHLGNGPFRLTAWHERVAVEVERNPHYWNAGQVALNGIRFLVIDEPAAEERAFMAGQLHLTDALPPQRLAAWQRANKPELRVDPYLGTYYVLPNCRRPPLDDPRVRRALSLAIDRVALTNNLLGAGQRPAWSFTPDNMPGYTPPLPPPGDLAEARRLLAEAGFPAGAGFPRLSYLFNTSESHRRIAEALQAMWREHLGIQVDLLNQEWRVYLDRRAQGDFDLARAVWIGDYPDPHSFLSLWTGASTQNWSGWRHPDYDTTLARASRLTQGPERAAALAGAESILLREQAVIPLYFYVTVYLKRPEVQGWYPNLLDWHPFQYVRLHPDL